MKADKMTLKPQQHFTLSSQSETCLAPQRGKKRLILFKTWIGVALFFSNYFSLQLIKTSNFFSTMASNLTSAVSFTHFPLPPTLFVAVIASSVLHSSIYLSLLFPPSQTVMLSEYYTHPSFF